MRLKQVTSGQDLNVGGKKIDLAIGSINWNYWAGQIIGGRGQKSQVLEMSFGSTHFLWARLGFIVKMRTKWILHRHEKEQKSISQVSSP